jgi:hypothetical protein
MKRKSGAPASKGPAGPRRPEPRQGHGEDAEETARTAEEDAARAENEGYPLGRPDGNHDDAMARVVPAIVASGLRRRLSGAPTQPRPSGPFRGSRSPPPHATWPRVLRGFALALAVAATDRSLVLGLLPRDARTRVGCRH